MITRAAFSAALAALTALSAAWGADDDAAKREMKKLEGSWRAVSATENGKVYRADWVNRFRLTVKGDTFKCIGSIPDLGTFTFEGTYKIVEVRGKTRKTDLSENGPKETRGKIIPQLAEWLDDDTRVRTW